MWAEGEVEAGGGGVVGERGGEEAGLERADDTTVGYPGVGYLAELGYI